MEKIVCAVFDETCPYCDEEGYCRMEEYEGCTPFEECDAFYEEEEDGFVEFEPGRYIYDQFTANP